MSTIEAILKSPHTARLDTEILLAHQLAVPRAYLYTHPHQVLSQKDKDHFFKLIERCKKGEPVAYITGKREFWSLDLEVTPNTLIPRPETETVVEWALELGKHSPEMTVADLGTGSGAIVLALAHTKTNWTVHGTDISAGALLVAKRNAVRLNILNSSFYEGDWCEALPIRSYDMIISNPPYVAKEDSYLEKNVLDYEPHLALFAGEGGLQYLKDIIYQARDYLKPGGYLILEHGFQQASQVQAFLSEHRYSDIETKPDLSGLPRVTLAKNNMSVATQ